MITFTRKAKVVQADGTEYELEFAYEKMDDKMFEKYKQNPLGMTGVVREHFKIPENRSFTVSMDNGTEGCVWIGPIPKVNKH